jgi:hypothetical protein
MNADARAWEEGLCAAIRTGKLGFIPSPLRPGPYAVHDVTDQQRAWHRERQQANPDSSTEVSREQLKQFAKNSGKIPKFLEG